MSVNETATFLALKEAGDKVLLSAFKFLDIHSVYIHATDTTF